MFPANFEYLRPSTVEDAVALLARYGGDAKVLAGGHSLIPAMKLRLATPKVVIDIGRIANLSYIREHDDRIHIGAMTTHQEIASSALLQERCPLLAEVAAHIGDVQVRNRGTIGGSLAHADPAADYPAAILVLNAEMELAGPKGKRTVRAPAFFTDLLTTAIGAGEILTEIRLPVTDKAVAYVKTEQKASGFALAGVAVVVGATGVRVGVTGVGPKAYRATAVEQSLGHGHSQPHPRGGDKQPRIVTPSADAIALAASHAADGIEPLGDIHASPSFRAHLAQVNTKRAIEKAFSRA